MRDVTTRKAVICHPGPVSGTKHEHPIPMVCHPAICDAIFLPTCKRAPFRRWPGVIAQALLPAAKVQEEVQHTLLTGLRAASLEIGDQLNAAIEKLPAELKQTLVQRLNSQ